MSDEPRKFTVHLEQQEDFSFNVSFDLDAIPDLEVDEPPPLGEAAGPNPARLVGVAAAHCLSASLLFCLQRSRNEPENVSATVIGTITRNDKGRLRLSALEVELELEGVDTDNNRVRRCLGMFEDFCVVTEAIRNGIPIDVKVVDQEGAVLMNSQENGDGASAPDNG
ncbi:MAG: OsmC family protein [Gammaproteobacteria bacterium]